jgi:hypothetical protein
LYVVARVFESRNVTGTELAQPQAVPSKSVGR